MMSKKIIPYGKQYIDHFDIDNIKKSLTAEKITQGRFVDIFESKIKKYLNVFDAITCTSGTAALHLAFLTLDLKKNDIIIMPSINFVAAFNLATSMGARVILADVNSITGQMTPENLEDCIKKHNLKKIKIILTMYLGGSAENVKEFYNIKIKHKCFLVEDACHAFGSEYTHKDKRIKIGSCTHSDLCCFSLHPIKAITTGEGGIITTKNKDIGKKIRRIRSHGLVQNKLKYWEYTTNGVGLNYRLNDISCALGISQLKKINFFLKKRKIISAIYQDKLSYYKNYITIPNYKSAKYNSWHLFLIKIDFQKLNCNKDHFIKYLNKFKIFPQFHYIPLYRLKMMDKNLINKYPNSEIYYKNNISLPIYVNLSKINQIFVINKVLKFINLYKKNNV